MKKYLIIFGVAACAACNNSNKAAEQVHENDVRQRTIDSMALIDAHRDHAHASYHHEGTTTNSSAPAVTNTEPAKRKGMSNTTKGALIGTGAGVVGGALTGAATSKDRGKGALIGGAVGGAVGSGVGYGVGANKDKKEKEQNNADQ